MRRLDTSKSYGTIVNHPRYRYEQDGAFFDSQGYEIEQTQLSERAIAEAGEALRNYVAENTAPVLDKRRDWSPERLEAHRKRMQEMHARRKAARE